MFNTDIRTTECFPKAENISQQILEIRSIVTDLEFRREEMCEGMDRLQRALNSISLKTSDIVNK